MNAAKPNVSYRRVGLTLALAALVAGLMLVAALVKQSAPAGSYASEIWEGVILALAVIALFVPMLALRLPSSGKSSSGSAK